MKQLTLAAVLALAALVLAQPKASAEGLCEGLRVHYKSAFRSHGCGCHVQLGPWYSYWPHDAHFQTPAPTGYPFWPTGMTSAGHGGFGGGSCPSYWYGH